MTNPARDDAGGLSPSQIAAYRDRGYFVLRGRFSSVEATAWKDECDRLWADTSLFAGAANNPAGARAGAAGQVIRDRLDPVLGHSPVFRDLARDERLTEALRALLQDDVNLFKDKLIVKPPGTSGYGLHQDFPYWEELGLPPDGLINAWIAIDAADASNGAVELFPGLHRERQPAPPGKPLDMDESAIAGCPGELAEAAPGDVLIFHSMAPHRSGPNRSSAWRRSLIFTYSGARHGDLYRTYLERRKAS